MKYLIFDICPFEFVHFIVYKDSSPEALALLSMGLKQLRFLLEYMELYTLSAKRAYITKII